MINYKKCANLPYIVKSFCFSHRAWVVGSAANYLISESSNNPRDWDILVPLKEWLLASRLIPKGSVTNSFGGIKFEVDDIEVDVWPMDVDDYLANVPEDKIVMVNPLTRGVISYSRGWLNRKD